MDESDVILNCCEKGSLNFFLEQIKVPVIWISNTTRWIENSTLRRFNYSIHFDRPDAEKRLQVWESVVSEHGASSIIPQDVVKRFSEELQITAGGITQAIVGAKKLVLPKRNRSCWTWTWFMPTATRKAVRPRTCSMR